MIQTSAPRAETDVYFKAPDVAGYAEVPHDEKVRLFEQVKADFRFGDYLYGCYECGICVAACPSAKFYDFSPRRVAQAAAREDVDLVYQQMQEDIWECSQCFSCLRCPRGNNPGGIITIMREVAVNNGLASAKQALVGYSRIIYKIMSTGTQVSPDMLRADAFPDWDPRRRTSRTTWTCGGGHCLPRRCTRPRPGGRWPTRRWSSFTHMARDGRVGHDRGSRSGPALDPAGADGRTPRGRRHPTMTIPIEALRRQKATLER